MVYLLVLRREYENMAMYVGCRAYGREYRNILDRDVFRIMFPYSLLRTSKFRVYGSGWARAMIV